MKRLYIVVEGQTERDFVKDCLFPYLNEKYGIESVIPIVINTNPNERGGFSKYSDLEKNIKNILHSKSVDLVVSMFVDFYRMPPNVPGFAEAKKLSSHIEQVEVVERSIDERINDRRFHSYIQLHEFETLLFSSNAGFEAWFTRKESVQTLKIVEGFHNPEDINTTPQGAPSKRILAIKPNYDKVIEGNFIAQTIGMQVIIDKCPRFSKWVASLVNMCKENGKFNV